MYPWCANRHSGELYSGRIDGGETNRAFFERRLIKLSTKRWVAFLVLGRYQCFRGIGFMG